MRRRSVLAAEILFSYLLARRSLHRKGLTETLSALRAPRRRASPRPPAELARATALTLGAIPGIDGRCLMQSLVLTSLLSRRGVQSALVIAVRPGDSFGAHAWVESDGRPLLPAEGPGFGRLVTL